MAPTLLRLEALAEPSWICVSAAHGQVRDKLDFDFEDMGEQQVKNIAGPDAGQPTEFLSVPEYWNN
jgi:hypothetical protein